MTGIPKHWLLIVGLIFSCSDKATRQEKNKEHLDKVFSLHGGEFYADKTSADGTANYSLYLPKGFEPSRLWPVTILLDPHAEVEEVVNEYKEVADRHGHILIGSSDFRNGLDMEKSNRIVAALLREATGSLRADPASVHLIGFSGGAKAAIAAATSTSGITTLTYCGSAFPQGSVRLPLPSLGVAGVRDMNFTEVLNFTTSLDTIPYLHSFFVSDADHSWPDTSVFELAMSWSDSWNCRNSKTCDSSLISYSASLCKERIRKENDPIRRDLLLHFHLAAFHDLLPVEEERKFMDENQRSVGFRSAMGRFVNELELESRRRQELAAAFTTKDKSWWKQTMTGLRAASDPVSDRLADYCSLAAYSYSRSTLDAGERPNAEYFIGLYELIDPENAEWSFLRACLCEQAGDRAGTIRNLRTAYRMGMKEKDKIKEEKWLAAALTDPEMIRLLEEMDQAR